MAALADPAPVPWRVVFLSVPQNPMGALVALYMFPTACFMPLSLKVACVEDAHRLLPPCIPYVRSLHEWADALYVHMRGLAWVCPSVPGGRAGPVQQCRLLGVLLCPAVCCSSGAPCAGLSCVCVHPTQHTCEPLMAAQPQGPVS
jgi:hypothetical protein